jgi:hypothetical protein
VDVALGLFRRVTEKDPLNAEAWIQQAMLEQARYRDSLLSAEEALRCYEKAAHALKQVRRCPGPRQRADGKGRGLLAAQR